MNTVEQDILILREFSDRKVLYALLKSIERIQSGIIHRTRLNLQTRWNDNIWGSDEIDEQLILNLFSLMQMNQTRWSNGGSWSPEGEYLVNIYRCKSCDEIFEIQVPETGEKWKPDFKQRFIEHFRRCDVVKELEHSSDSMNDFRYRLLQISLGK